MKLETKRLILRDWRADDIDALAEIMGDADARPFHPNTYTYLETQDLLDGFIARPNPLETLRAAQLKQTGQLIGLVGFTQIGEIVRKALKGAPTTEIGWQFNKEFWGQGFATEGALACLDHAWNTLNLSEIVSFTFSGNQSSQRVMQKIGMTRDHDSDFDHPKLPPEHFLRPHVLYRVKNPLL